MDYYWFAILVIPILLLMRLVVGYRERRREKAKGRRDGGAEPKIFGGLFQAQGLSKEDLQAQKQLNEFLSKELSTLEIGTAYERYIGYLFEIEGYVVEYHGAINGYSDLGRDLILINGSEIYIVQTKRWAQFKKINEKHIFQLYGSMEHYKLTSKKDGYEIKAIFCTSAQFSKTARDVADELGVELYTKKFDHNYPRIKCNNSQSGDKIYHLPFDPYYDKIKIEIEKGDCFVYTVKEAVDKGFRRARNYQYAS